MKLNPATAKVLIASDNVDDAMQILEQLKVEMEQVRVSTNADLAVKEFEDFEPDVVVLAFDSMEKAQRYCFELYRHGAGVNRHPHRTVLLCAKGELRAAFDLCKKGSFDDYVLHWPMSHDGLRLPMSVWNAARDMLAQARRPSTQDLLVHAQQLGAVESLLDRQLAEGGRHAASATQTLQQAETEVGAAIDEFARRLTNPGPAAVVEVKDPTRLSREFDRLKNDRLAPAFKASADGLAPIARWPQQVREQLAPHMTDMRGFATKVRKAARVVMVVDDDDIARKLIAWALQDQDFELVFAEDGAAAFGLLRRTRPDLILMDINLPDIDGVTLTAKLKADPHLADIPVLMLTGEARREALTDSIGAGAAGFIVKPFTRAALVAKVRRILPAAG